MELLAVIAIIVIIIAFVAPAANSVVRGSQLTRSSQLTIDVLELAKQVACSKNQAVEVRFYQYGDAEVPGESASSPNSGKFRAMQIFVRADSGAYTALGKVQALPPAIIFDAGQTLSSLLGASLDKTWAGNPQPKLPKVGTNYNCRYFQFRPDVSTNLATVGTPLWFVTAHSINDGDGLGAPPKNYSTIQVDATNGHTTYYRP